MAQDDGNCGCMRERAVLQKLSYQHSIFGEIDNGVGRWELWMNERKGEVAKK